MKTSLSVFIFIFIASIACAATISPYLGFGTIFNVGTEIKDPGSPATIDMETAAPFIIGLEAYPDTWVSGKHSAGIGASFSFFQRDSEKVTVMIYPYETVDFSVSADYSILDLFGIHRYELSEGIYLHSTAGLGYYKADNAKIEVVGYGSADIDGDSVISFLLSVSVRKNFADNQIFLGGGLKYVRLLSDLEYTDGVNVLGELSGSDTMLYIIFGLNF